MHRSRCGVFVSAASFVSFVSFCSNSLAVELYCFYDLPQIIWHRDGPVGERGAADAAAAEDLVELLLIGRVIGDGRGGVLELMAGENADNPLVGPNHALIA